mmetsp:Transcript_107513/g.342811  ORF Transcript_107513/g.342811 Transcript_107513/m.342811 type:complete len:232 (-) Transcript_107513:1115-1810(-)
MVMDTHRAVDVHLVVLLCPFGAEPTLAQRLPVLDERCHGRSGLQHLACRYVSDRPLHVLAATGAGGSRLLLRGGAVHEGMPLGLLAWRLDQHLYVLVLEAGRLRHATEVHRGAAWRQPLGAAGLRSAQALDSNHRECAATARDDCWEGCHIVRWPRLADLCARRDFAALAPSNGTWHDTHLVFRRALLAFRQLLLEERGRRALEPPWQLHVHPHRCGLHCALGDDGVGMPK